MWIAVFFRHHVQYFSNVHDIHVYWSAQHRAALCRWKYNCQANIEDLCQLGQCVRAESPKVAKFSYVFMNISATSLYFELKMGLNGHRYILHNSQYSNLKSDFKYLSRKHLGETTFFNRYSKSLKQKSPSIGLAM